MWEVGMKRNVFPVIVALFATGLLCGGVGSQNVGLPDRFPQEQSGNNWCATSPETNARLEELNDWVAARERAFLAKYGVRLAKEPGVRLQNGIFLVEADATTAPFDHPFDLENSSLMFARKDSQTYIVSKSALVYDPDPGPLFHTFRSSSEPDWYYKAYRLTKFNFPFYDLTANELYFSAQRGIYFSPPTRARFRQYGPLEVIGEQVPVIAPLLHPAGPEWLISQYLFLKEGSDALTLTWRSKTNPDWEPTFDLDIQVTLYKNGNILFSYRLVKNVPWGAVIVTSGKESWRTSKTELLSARDFLGDVDARVEPEWRDPLDIDSVTVERIGQSDLLEFRLKLKTTVTPAAIPADRSLSFGIGLSDGENFNGISLTLYKDRYVYSIPGWGETTSSPAATFEGQTLVFRVLESLLTLKSSTVTFEVSTHSPSTLADSLRTAFELDRATMPLELDFSSIGRPVEITRPIFEVFTLPSLNLYKVWERLKAAYGLTDDEIDGVAVYQNFFTDVILSAGGYSTVGNSGADGVGWSSSKFPRYPALLHVNKMGYSFNSTDRGAMYLLIHEFGHRWLYYFQIMEGGVKSNILNPARFHPAQYVHTAAAYPVFTPTDYSIMGGSRFTDHGNGTFSTPREPGHYSFSWHELYLMGLASPREVEDWFYIANSNPPLGEAYNAPVNWTGSGTRKNVNIQQIIDAMGPRVPPYETSEKSFKVLFVVMERPTARATDAEVDQVTIYRLNFEKYFTAATGNRAEVITTTVPLPVVCTATVASDRWRGEYYPNTSLSGTPAMVRDDGAGFLEFNWGAGSPAILCLRRIDEFSARWTRTVSLEGGVYRFTIVSDDGFRLYVDGSLKLEKWFDQRATTYMVDVPISAGNHTIRLEYYDNLGDALIKLSWQKVR
jgi:hypothetical protein